MARCMNVLHAKLLILHGVAGRTKRGSRDTLLQQRRRPGAGGWAAAGLAAQQKTA
jgi:hypothetical protein